MNPSGLSSLTRPRGFLYLREGSLGEERKTVQGILVTADADLMKEVFDYEQISKGGAPCRLSLTREKVQGRWTLDNLIGFPFCKRQDVL
jgi:hypothetical protein